MALVEQSAIYRDVSRIERHLERVVTALETLVEQPVPQPSAETPVDATEVAALRRLVGAQAATLEQVKVAALLRGQTAQVRIDNVITLLYQAGSSLRPLETEQGP